MTGIPVVISEHGFGIPVRAVESGAPLMRISAHGLGMPIVISDYGTPFVVEGLTPPVTDFWQSFNLTAGEIVAGADEWQSFNMTAGEL